MSVTLTRRSALLACAATGLAGCAAQEGPGVPETPGARSTGPGPTRRPRARPPASPRHLAIPSIGVSARLVGLGLQDDGTVEVPSVRGTAGWFRLGTVPGRRGSAVILGHVDSVDGPDVFADLSALRSPDRVQVVLSDDSLVTFEVTGIETYANADFPADLVYAGTRRRRELNLVTCGGDYDRERGGYQSNVVVFTRRTRA
ncbi:sortase [Nocardioides sp.]|uniref:sortase domain-containing protein n=1 Tax=Nocardioides sp. TaxID=35761 RepID=UPI00262208AF|nr:sortase [Nocardioides sp.]MCW2737081.1 Sortase family protein [Nocardioides sp.]